MIAISRLLLALIFVMSTGCDKQSTMPNSQNNESESVSKQSMIEGSASYRERIALLPGARFEAELLDVSRQDVAAITLGKVTIPEPGQVPIRFEIPYDGTQIIENHSYVVRAKIMNGDRLLYTTDRAYPVLTRGSGSTVTITMVRQQSTPP